MGVADGTDGADGADGTDGNGTENGDADAGTMTLAFSLSAFEALLDPHAVFADARQWCRYVGVVDDDAAAVEAAVRKHGVRQDFEIGSLDRQSVLSKLKWEAATDRYVFVGTTEDDRELADYVGWEYVPVDDAAGKAGWTLTAEAGYLERLRAVLSRATVSGFPLQ